MCWLPICRGFLKGSPLKPPHGHPPTALSLRFLAATFEDALYVMTFYFVMDFYLLVFRGSRFAWIGLPLDCLPTAPRHDRPKFRDCRLAVRSLPTAERLGEVSQWWRKDWSLTIGTRATRGFLDVGDTPEVSQCWFAAWSLLMAERDKEVFQCLRWRKRSIYGYFWPTEPMVLRGFGRLLATSKQLND